MTTHQDHGTMQECIEACQLCHDTCETTLKYCLDQGGAHAAADHIRTLKDCVESCAKCVTAMQDMSPSVGAVCRECAERCNRCADSCVAFGEDATMQRCAEVCRACAQTCDAMA